MKQKSFKKMNCSNLLNENNFQNIKPGLTFNEVCKLLGNNGDNKFYSQGSSIYVWYSCTKKELFYRINFTNGIVQMVVNSK
ncbi:MAG: hypothetical protein H0X46_07520 [Bacteroidetes bacterium]|nr:hypothetical protein [Bacteroidota bacterium]